LISDLANTERPRERFEQMGAGGASQRELLAILLRTGPRGIGVLKLADELLRKFGGLNGLARASLGELKGVHGVGRVKAVELKAALELGRRMALSSRDEQVQIKSPADAAQLLMLESGMAEQEEVRTILLDVRNKVLGIHMIYRGGIDNATLRAGDVFKEAVRNNARNIILSHNHPSGDPSPSSEDVRATRHVIEAGKLLGIDLLDHIIIAQNSYVSMKERGLAFE
jgi:DNA repair protein RadC